MFLNALFFKSSTAFDDKLDHKVHYSTVAGPQIRIRMLQVWLGDFVLQRRIGETSNIQHSPMVTYLAIMRQCGGVTSEDGGCLEVLLAQHSLPAQHLKPTKQQTDLLKNQKSELPNTSV